MEAKLEDISPSRLDKVLTFLIFSTLFFNSYVFFQSPFEGYFGYIIIILLIPFFLIRYELPKKLILFISLLFVTGGVSVLNGDNTLWLLFKITLNLTISSLFYYFIFQVFNQDIRKIFKFYMKGAYIVAVIGLVQVLSYVIGFKFGYDYTWVLNKWGVIQGGLLGIRLNSVFSEPSYYGISIAPAFFVACYNMMMKGKQDFLKPWQYVIIIISYFLTFSSVAYLGIFVTLLLFLINFGFARYVFIVLPLIIGLYTYLYQNINEFSSRIDGLQELFIGEEKNSFNVHGSSFVLYNNYTIATENFLENPLWGTGLGSHQIAYDRYSVVKEFGGIYEFNRSDANSMGLRIMSETGLIGIIFMLFVIFKFYIFKWRSRDERGELWVLSNAALVVILLQLLRQGNYTYNGFFFYMWLYYYIWRGNSETDVKEQVSD